MCLNGLTTLLVSGQTGPQSVVRVWKLQTAECLAMFKTHAHSLSCLRYVHEDAMDRGRWKMLIKIG